MSSIVPEKRLKLMIGTPCFAGMTYSAHTRSCVMLTDWLVRNGVDYRWSHIDNESLISRARNVIAHNFVSSDCTHLLMVDGDISFQPSDVVQLINAQADMAYASYAQKIINWRRVKEAVDSEIPADQLHWFSGTHVNKAMCGFALIERSVFARMREQFPADYLYGGVRMTAYYDTQIIDDEYLSEDYLFAHRLREMGGHIVYIPSIKLVHMGTYPFSGVQHV